ncbi:restriction endonuclease-like protein [Methanobrevibacter arboriphilus JCM 13429 = DSM 1125]|uniref:Restriction endonuclease-like protein n=1 Tax=Methanobrevibacter arboriphilus JCM 13429 = DSM 1125 TaxID=1300164 RepID=A0A1V6N050_METAZ|nr:restriction endonuclease [Methanobrevibacter arboriphilus]OQD58014.1 restriction endonuclease-like protein [Methanobrevibacter arboriphilus JCM 13429 = DSM 1125]
MVKDIVDYSLDNFLNLIIDLLVSMGYGGGRKQTQTNLKIIDNKKIIVEGVINEDILGFRKIYLQARQSRDMISKIEVEDFIKKLNDCNAENGVFITTSDFENKKYNEIKNIRLINGVELINLISEYGT